MKTVLILGILGILILCIILLIKKLKKPDITTDETTKVPPIIDVPTNPINIKYYINTTYATCTPNALLGGYILVNGKKVLINSSDNFEGTITVNGPFYINTLGLTLNCNNIVAFPTYFKYKYGTVINRTTNFLVDPKDGVIVYMEISDTDNISFE